jgi:endonuclease-3
MTDDLDALRIKYRAITAALRDEYGTPNWQQHLSPVDQLINTILSQNTSDTNRDAAFERLKARFASWEEVRTASPEAVIEAIRPAGLANQKGPSIQAALDYLARTQGKITLDHLADMPLDQAKAWLTSIHGVGPKTAAIVLLFAFGRPAFPVDTHVHRVTRRLGLIGPKVSAEKAHDVLEGIVPPDDYYSFHINVIQHGRRVCVARDPRCGVCVLQPWCDYFAALTPAQQAQKRRATG